MLYKYSVPEKPKKFDRICAPGDSFGFLTSIVAKHLKIEGGPFHDDFFSNKSPTMPKKPLGKGKRKNEKGPFGLFNIHCVAEHQKVEGDPSGNFFSESLTMFCFSSLSQTLQFGTIKFRRTFKS